MFSGVVSHEYPEKRFHLSLLVGVRAVEGGHIVGILLRLVVLSDVAGCPRLLHFALLLARKAGGHLDKDVEIEIARAVARL